jgi:SAM-dependent methyltransferase
MSLKRIAKRGIETSAALIGSAFSAMLLVLTAMHAGPLWRDETNTPRNASVLDVGSGDGRLARLVADKRPDISIQGIDVLVRTDAAIPVVKFDGTSIPYGEGSFDVVMLVDVLHHTVEPMILLRGGGSCCSTNRSYQRSHAPRSVRLLDAATYGLGGKRASWRCLAV